MPTNTNFCVESEVIQSIPMSKIFPFPNHPFRVRDDELMHNTIESIKEVGILNPVILRPVGNDSYEMISGHRRMHAAALIGMKELPAIVRNMTADEAIIYMIDSNLQREEILPSERAMAYKLKLEAIKHQGRRNDLTSGQVGPKLEAKRSNQIVADAAGESVKQIQRYIRLTELDHKLQQMVDDKKMALTPAIELSYLKPAEQALLIETISSEQASPSLSQAQRLKKLSQEGKLNDDTMLDIMTEQKKPDNSTIVFTEEKLRRYFPRSFTPLQMEKTIYQLLERWQKQRQRQQER